MSKTEDDTKNVEENSEESINSLIKRIAEKVIEQRDRPGKQLVSEVDLRGQSESIGVRVQYGLAATLKQYYDENNIKVTYADGYVVATNDLFLVAKLHSPDDAVSMHNYLLENAVDGETALKVLNEGDQV